MHGDNNESRALTLRAIDSIAAQWVADTEPTLEIVAAEAELDAATEPDDYKAKLIRWHALWVARLREVRKHGNVY